MRGIKAACSCQMSAFLNSSPGGKPHGDGSFTAPAPGTCTPAGRAVGAGEGCTCLTLCSALREQPAGRQLPHLLRRGSSVRPAKDRRNSAPQGAGRGPLVLPPCSSAGPLAPQLWYREAKSFGMYVLNILRMSRRFSWLSDAGSGLLACRVDWACKAAFPLGPAPQLASGRSS